MKNKDLCLFLSIGLKNRHFSSNILKNLLKLFQLETDLYVQKERKRAKTENEEIKERIEKEGNQYLIKSIDLISLFFFIEIEI